MNRNETRLEFISNAISVIKQSINELDKNSGEYNNKSELLASLINERNSLIKHINID